MTYYILNVEYCQKSGHDGPTKRSEITFSSIFGEKKGPFSVQIGINLYFVFFLLELNKISLEGISLLKIQKFLSWAGKSDLRSLTSIMSSA